MKICKSLTLACTPVTLLFCLVSSTNASTPAHGSLVGHWTFDNPANVGEANVSSNLVANNTGAVYTAAGKSGGALSLNGSSFLQVDNSQTLAAGMPTGDSSFTLSAFIRTTFNGRGGIIGWGNYGSSGQVNAFRTARGEALAHYSWSFSYDLDPVSAPSLFNNTWYHVAATYDSATSMKRIYLDGVEIGSKSVPNLNVQNMRFTLGSTNGYENFNGLLDDVRVYNIALSSTEISSLSSIFDIDTDADGIFDVNDNCLNDANPLQENNDADALGDICDPDDDNDGSEDIVDNCPIDSNPFQVDDDFDGLGNACDATYDASSVAQYLEQVAAGMVATLIDINVSGGNGMIAKLTGNGGLIRKVANAVAAYEAGFIDTSTYLSDLQTALNVLTAFENQLNAKINKGKIGETDAASLLAAATDLRSTINGLVVAVGS